MQRAGFQLVYRVAHNGERAAKIQGLMTALAARRIQRDGQSALFAQHLHFADELVSRHGDIVGRKRPLCKRGAVGLAGVSECSGVTPRYQNHFLRVKLAHLIFTISLPMKLYGIPNCDTVKKARFWLDEHGHPAEFHDYKKQGVPLEVLKKSASQLGWELLVNKKGPTWRKQPDEVKAGVVDEASALAFLQTTSSAIKRPLLEINGQYHLGFSPEQYEELFRK